MGTEREGRQGRNGTENGERGGMHKRLGQRGLDMKRHSLVEDVSDYQEFYKGEGAD